MATREKKSTPGDRARDRGLARTLKALILVWFLVVLVAGSRGLFVAGPSQPPLPLLVAVVGPLAVFALVHAGSRRFRTFVLGLDLRVLTAVQAWRVLGAVFLALYAFRLLPGLFAWPAGLGDAGVGVAAVFVQRAMLVGAPNWPRRVWWLNVAGLLDFVGALGTGVLTSNTTLGLLASGAPRADLGALPLSLIPTFAVPLWAIAHLISLLQLRREKTRIGVAPV